ncbi:Lem3/Cdc50 [Metschnikowia bicuspidata var. bicuspidata NRRL YB-4993]|uniref:Lem3/Cdc50 n=1 Tax=Metschnikowia bicuspidata var. bicuspidata NRRL YB-4993 TaxID=869754 RepID=A0A1A0HDN2_9ASCO|nr:Lem3/Cdc50 [Metschnikowia bicuspidata var. bicuspidata NRRL YB-4993]OBA22033.1 Lem3/Cdc50 [Metschnikowia bicuspidata var. bicuspidata NRRL YB-4993]
MNFLRRRHAPRDEDSPGAEDLDPQIHKSRKPPNTAFRQQRLKAWQPILTPKTVIPLLFLVAAVFAPLGIALVYGTYNVQNLVVDYTHCGSLAGAEYAPVPAKYTAWHFRRHNTDPGLQWRVQNATDADGDAVQTCVLQFDLPRALDAPVYLYYKLTNFYQNHRLYVASYDTAQLGGAAVTAGALTLDCDPLRTRDGKPVYPCGLVANSLFNDTFGSPVLLNAQSGSDNETYELSLAGISWASDRAHKFKKTAYSADDVVPPPNWMKRFPDGYTLANMPDLAEWEHLQNWMRTAGLPTFYKLYAKNTTTAFASGTYEMEIGLNYPVSVYGGTKSVVLTTNSVLGGRNMTLGIVYLIVAAVCLLCAVAFFLQHLIKPRRIGDHHFLQAAADAPGSAARDQL